MKSNMLKMFSGVLLVAFVLVPVASGVSAQDTGAADSPSLLNTTLDVNVKSDTPVKSVADTNVRAQGSGAVRGDLNNDGIVGHADLKILLAHWGPCRTASGAGSATGCLGDLDGNGVVNTVDLATLLNLWTERGAAQDKADISSIPEKCQTISDSTLQRKCLIRVSQEVETDVRERRVIPSLENRLSTSATASDEVRDRIKVTARNYLKYMSNMLTRIAAAITRMDNLADRIESRITKLEAEGKNLDEQRRLLAEARVSITQAKANAAELSATYEAVLLSDDPKESFKKIRDMVRNIRDNVRNAHGILVKVIVSIKAGLLDTSN